MKITHIFKVIFYYVLLLVGLIITSRIILSHFICEHIPKDIPFDFTEYSFWILLYISCIYLYIVKSLIKQNKTNLLLKEIIENFYKPLKILDQHLKYNILTPYYDTFMKKSINLIDISHINIVFIKLVLFFMQIFPRIILVNFLLLDTFYFSKLDLFYKILLISFIPLLYRYIKYTLKDIYEKWIEELEKQYYCVLLFEKGFEYNDEHKRYTEAIYHYEKKTIREYIDIKVENILEIYKGTVEYVYIGIPYCKKDFVDHYILKKYNNIKTYPGSEDLKLFKFLFKTLMPYIITLNMLFSCIEYLNENPLIKWPKVTILFLYFICWLYILLFVILHTS